VRSCGAFGQEQCSVRSISREAHENTRHPMNLASAQVPRGKVARTPTDTSPTATAICVEYRWRCPSQVAHGRVRRDERISRLRRRPAIKMRRARSPARAVSLPGYKIYPWIAKTRHSTPGSVYSPTPPHHDIYRSRSQELIHDLKNSIQRAGGVSCRRGRVAPSLRGCPRRTPTSC